jgi:hypothetical protein
VVTQHCAHLVRALAFCEALQVQVDGFTAERLPRAFWVLLEVEKEGVGCGSGLRWFAGFLGDCV